MASDPFFQSSKKRKRPTGSSARASSSKEPHRPSAYGKGKTTSKVITSRRGDESLSDQSSDAGGPADLEDIDFQSGRLTHGQAEWDSEEEAIKEETAGEKRVRLAKKYLGKVRDELVRDENEGGIGFDAEEIDRELIAGRLKMDVDAASTKIYSFLGESFLPGLLATTTTTTKKSESLFVPALNGRVPTAAVLCPSNGELFVSDKGGWIGWWSLEKRTVVAGEAEGLDVEMGEVGEDLTAFPTSTTVAISSKGKGKSHPSATHLLFKPFGQAPKPSSQPIQTSSKSKSNTKSSLPNNGGGHKGPILCLSVSEDGRYLVSGGKDKTIGVWELVGGKGKGKKVGLEEEKRKVKWLKGLGGHKDTVTSLIIPPLSNPSHHLLSASLSRSLTLHSLSTLSQIDTFFGHQDSITSVSALTPLSCVTAGSRDRTVRWWKVEEEVQLVFRGGGKTFEGGKKGKGEEVVVAADDEELAPTLKKQKVEGAGVGKRREFWEGSVDVVCVLDDQHFLSGGDSGSISLWHTGKKKPIFTQSLAHGADETVSESEGSIVGARWITSLAALRGTDVFASGSWNGEIKLWKLERTLKSFSLLYDIPALGFVNSLQISAVSAGVIDSSQWIKKQSTVETTSEDADMEASEEETPAPVALRARAKPESDYVLIAALSKEPRLGRWMNAKSMKGVKNGTLVVHLKRQN